MVLAVRAAVFVVHLFNDVDRCVLFAEQIGQHSLIAFELGYERVLCGHEKTSAGLEKEKRQYFRSYTGRHIFDPVFHALSNFHILRNFVLNSESA